MTQQAPAMASRIECQRCHTSNEPDARFCKMCGASPRERPMAPTLTHVLEETEIRVKTIDPTGQKRAEIEYKVNTWLLGGTMPEDPTTEIKAMFKTPDGVKVHVSPKEGNPGFQHKAAYIVEIPAKSIRLSMKTLPQSIQDNEIALDQLQYQYGDDGEEEDDAEDEMPAVNGSPAAGMPTLPAGQG
jgi:hypothetical protein